MSLFVAGKDGDNWVVFMGTDVLQTFGPGFFNFLKAINLCAKLRQGERLDE